MYLCSCLQAIVMSPLNPPRLAGRETGLPPRFRGGPGWGNFMGNSFSIFKQFHFHTNSRVYNEGRREHYSVIPGASFAE